jgi:ABC-type transporter Mla subunit MlaD
VRPCAASFPNILGRADRVLSNVNEVLSRVDGTLGRVDGTLGDVSSTLSTVDERLEDVGTAPHRGKRNARRGEGLLAGLEGEIALVKQLPEIAQQVREIHEAVTAANAA